jgi:nucleotide-binding universal stress UspA family protein
MGSVICGIDDSDAGRGAARVARVLSNQLGLDLVFVRVLAGGSSAERIDTSAERLEHLRGAACEADCGADWIIETGHPADQLVAVAAKTGATMIVVGSDGPRWSRLGSISADVSQRAPCPVVVVPPGADAALRNSNDSAGSVDRLALRGVARFDLASRAA